MVVDALIVTDQELIEQFIEDVTGPVDRNLVDRALGYVDLESIPVDVLAYGHAGVYDASRVDELEEMFRNRMRSFYGDNLRVLSRRIEIEDDKADLGLTLISKRGRQSISLKMQKLNDKWWVSAVRTN